MRKSWMKLAIAVPAVLVVLVTAGTWVYLNLIKDDPPDRLTLHGGTSTDPSAGTTAAAGDGTDTAADGSDAESGIDGTWKVVSGSRAGYRVKEILFGQSAEAVGRTDDVTGTIAIEGSTVTRGSFTVDMTTVASDESRRDNQFRTRIMNVSAYPTSTFELSEPISLASVPEDGTEVGVKATGRLTLRGTTKEVTVALQAQRSGSSIKVAGSVPVVFEEWGIPNPSFGPADTEDNGELEFLLVLGR
ncbi:MAG TPA: YceI family protein [Acidimicrobiales bacterium]|nr:YceI family protein [Acidimicrobiales bacterium]